MSLITVIKVYNMFKLLCTRISQASSLPPIPYCTVFYCTAGCSGGPVNRATDITQHGQQPLQTQQDRTQGLGEGGGGGEVHKI